MAHAVILLVIFSYLLHLIVSLQNYKSRWDPIPEIVRGIYKTQEYQRWLQYTMEHFRLGLATRTFGMVVLVVALSTGLFGRLATSTETWFDAGFWQTLSFLGVLYLIPFFASLPVEYYKTFGIEEKYGFNKTTRKTFFLDQGKSLVLTGLVGTLVVGILYALYILRLDRLWSFIGFAWIAISLLSIVVFVLNTKVLVKIFNKLTPLEEGQMKNAIEALALKVGFQVKSISVMDASKRTTKLNAFFSGLGKTRAVVLYDTLLKRLSKEEVLAVLAHELGHAMHRDIPRMLFLQILLLGFYALTLGFLLQSEALATAFQLQGIHFGFALVLFGIFMTFIDPVVSIPLNYLQRKAEYKADAFSVRYVGALAMKNALCVIAKENYANLTPHPWYVLLHYSHPPMALRLAAIDKVSAP